MLLELILFVCLFVLYHEVMAHSKQETLTELYESYTCRTADFSLTRTHNSMFCILLQKLCHILQLPRVLHYA